ncbi:UPAR/Ly6 domain-containing protein bou [Onthophagus taurus]|uniref:UPAR/Ly6 domain-containing protein bou n=1 Tax=Onthophagus taurus TaxID=166361 RepID=UPI0039BDEA52
MFFEQHRVIISTILVGFLIENSLAINCYQCASTNTTSPFQCNEYLKDADILAESCDGVHGARYCVKHTGRFEALAINCYQCSSSKSLECSDGMIHMNNLELTPTSCDHVFEAQYCVKSISLEGGIGTKRFCSSLDLGNYCNFVQQPGDKLQYRTCIYTCTRDGCNSGEKMRSNLVILGSILCLIHVLYFR